MDGGILLSMTRTLTFILLAAGLFAQASYKKPPEAILRVLNATATPVAK